MKALMGCFLCCLSAVAADTHEIRVFTRTDSKATPGYLVAFEEFTRDGQTNLLRVTTIKDGVTNGVAHNFYYRGEHLGRYGQDRGYSFVNTAAGAPCLLAFAWDSSNQLRNASVMTTNHVLLDSFTFTNGMFHPDPNSAIEESNKKASGVLRY